MSKADAPSPPDSYVKALAARAFDVEELIGRGAYGSVYRATQRGLRRDVAVKFLDNPNALDESNRKRFQREAPLLARVEHPGVPYVITTGNVPGGLFDVPYIVMQFIRGEGLDALIAREHRLEPSLAARIACEVLDALECAHKNNVIHRDVKPNNILRGAQRTWLLDFSIGICLDTVPGLTRATNTGQRVGTADYASPEQQKDSSLVDHRTDIYSMGVVLFEMLFGHPRVNLAGASSPMDVPPELVAAINTACAPALASRYQTATHFRDALALFVGSVTADARGSALALCPTIGCARGKWSDRGYFLEHRSV